MKLVQGEKTQKELGELLHIAQPSVNRLLTGENLPGFEVILRLAEIGYNANWLLTGKGGMYLTEERSTVLSPEMQSLAERLGNYPEIVSTLREAIELREKLDRTKQELKMEFQRMKKK